MKLNFKHALITAFVALPLSACGQSPAGPPQHDAQAQGAAGLHAPESIALEHREIHETLERATTEGGALGSAARTLEAAVAPHFKREEEIATPPLGLLQNLAEGDATAEMRSVLPMTQALEREMPQMLREHEAVRAALTQFRAAAQQAGKDDYVRFADNFAAHAREEEEILYPAAILVGRYVDRTAPRQ